MGRACRLVRRCRRPDRGAGPRHRAGWSRRAVLVRGRTGLAGRGRRAAFQSESERCRIQGTVGALRRRQDLRDHPAVRLLSHRVVSGERAGFAVGGKGGAVSALAVIPGRPAGLNPESRGSGFALRAPRNDETPYATPARSTSWTWTMPTGFLPSATISTITAGFDELTLSRMISEASMPGAIVRGFLVITSSTATVIRSGRSRRWRRRSPSVMMPAISPE